MNKDRILEFATLTESELSTIEKIQLALQLRPSGKLDIQTSAMNLDELSHNLSDIICSLEFQKDIYVDQLDIMMADYSETKMAVFTDKQIYFKLLNEKTSEVSLKYKLLKSKKDRLISYLSHLERIMWIIKSRNSMYTIAHKTDY